MKRGWLVYEAGDLAKNRDFAEHITRLGLVRGLEIETVRMAQLRLGVREGGALLLRKDGRDALPDFVLARHRDAFVSTQFERMGVPVFNGAGVCAVCNDKRVTHQYLAGLPMLATTFVNHRYAVAPPEDAYPLVVKPARSHGGDRVRLVANEYEWRTAVDDILPQDIMQQQPASDAGADLRVYVLFGQVVAGVMRTATRGFVSNFGRGGSARLHTLTDAERALAQQVIDRFRRGGMELCFAGVDMLYHHGAPVLGEVEDVVGSRMLYQTSKLDIAALYLDGVAARL
jgi:ribosomal protein S6--L-glutamate ligase/gamma-F420-2:alpha-L-glutamate ligase